MQVHNAGLFEDLLSESEDQKELRSSPPSPLSSQFSTASNFSTVSERFHGTLYFPDKKRDAAFRTEKARTFEERRVRALNEKFRKDQERVDDIKESSRAKREKQRQNLGRIIVDQEIKFSERRKEREMREQSVREKLTARITEASVNNMESNHEAQLKTMRRLASSQIEKMTRSHERWSSREARRAETMKRIAERHDSRIDATLARIRKDDERIHAIKANQQRMDKLYKDARRKLKIQYDAARRALQADNKRRTRRQQMRSRAGTSYSVYSAPDFRDARSLRRAPSSPMSMFSSTGSRNHRSVSECASERSVGNVSSSSLSLPTDNVTGAPDISTEARPRVRKEECFAEPMQHRAVSLSSSTKDVNALTPMDIEDDFNFAEFFGIDAISPQADYSEIAPTRQNEIAPSPQKEIASFRQDNAATPQEPVHALQTVKSYQDVPEPDEWFYIDEAGQTQGPFSSAQMHEWYSLSYLVPSLLVQKNGSNPKKFASISSLFQNPDAAFMHEGR